MLLCLGIMTIFGVLLSNIHGRKPPKFEVVYPNVLETRDLTSDKVLQVKDGLVLQLKKSSILSENFVLTDLSGKIPVETRMNGKVVERNLYHDKHKLAVVEVKEKNGNVEVRGILSDTLRIVPLHLLVLAQEGPMAHKIFEVEASAHDGNDHIESNENKLQERADTIRFSPHGERKVPETFFVETLVVADQYLYRKFHNDTELIIYLATTMAAVNIRFANASDPKVGLLIVKIVKDPGTSFHRLFIGSAPGDQKKSLKIFANAPKTLSQFATKYQSSICDVALLVTGLELAETKGSSVSRLLKGLAYIDGLCQPMLHFGEVGDIPHTYSMLSAAAHEIGHILGMTHDGEIPSYPVPNVTWLRCDATLGYLMAPVLGGRNEGFFSNCSLQHMRILVSQQTDACYKVQSKTATEAPSRLPGVGLNMADLCKILHPGVGGMDGMLRYPYNEDCNFFCCPRNQSVPCILSRLIEGMPCSKNEICFRNRCGNYSTNLPPLPTLPTSERTIERNENLGEY